ncbi:zinc finger CCCH domain-containing protein 9-like [Curcuma longa]|uniref:zinc finger CCCH domain-containing protein 9-like n=1 Tax=Curcuma longa TaxID=136217 RepID=UPI003D9E5B9F
MQHELASSTNGDCLGSSSASAPFSFPDRQSLSPSYLNGDGNLSCPYSMLSNLEDTNSHLDPLLPASGSVSIFPSQISFDNPEESASGSKERFYLSRLALQYQQMIERYDVCFSHLRDATDEVKSLLQENASLRSANEELARRLGLFVGKHSGGRASASADAALAEELRRLGLADQPIPGESPTSVLAFQASGGGGGQQWFARPPVAEKQVSLPKSISIRSSGYLRLNQAGGSGSSSNRNCRFRTSNTSMVPSQQSMYVDEGNNKKKAEKGGETQEGGEGSGSSGSLELEVYHQGMFKTELCNKWEESGLCPYGGHCQFAHGIAELRPVLRHPRYKTELCRMVLFGDACPYGHRCHFRHSLSSADHQRVLRRPN